MPDNSDITPPGSPGADPSPDPSANPNPDPRTNVGGAGQIVDLNIERELQDSYLTYAMSTIIDRALPDVRDGLKPSQRRILVAMKDLSLGPRSKHYKCAKICGDTSGNYHPHGDQVVYPTLVRMGQDWNMRYPLIDPQGNFGSTDGDPPAASRYTEARMTGVAMELLADLELDTVPFQPNYDERLEEPTVLPSKFPNLLVNGSTGIAVGMACNLLPHNLREVADAIVHVIENPDCTLADLMQIVGGPDFPTGGIVMGMDGIVEGYQTGRGRLTLRARHHIEENKGRHTIVIDELPYGVIRQSIVTAVAEAVKSGRMDEVSGINDESGRKHACRIVIDLKRGVEPDVVVNQLWQYTPAQVTVSMINIAIVGRRPRTLSLKELIQHFIEHRREVIVRRTRHLLKKAQQRGHILEGLIYAVTDIDEVVRLIRSSSTREEAIAKLRERGFRIAPDHPYAPKIPESLIQRSNAVTRDRDGADRIGAMLSQVQAEAIGRLQLIQLVGLEIDRLVKEYAEVVQQIEDYQHILASDDAVLDIIREDVLEMKEKYGDDRRTEISQQGVSQMSREMLIPPEDVVVTLSHGGYIKRLPLDTYRAQGRGGRGIRGGAAREDDFIEHLFVGNTHDHLLFFTSTGRVYTLRVFDLPEAGRTSPGRSVAQLLDLQPGEKIAQVLSIADLEKEESYLLFATRGGTVKKTPLKAYANIRTNGIIAIGLADGDELIGVGIIGDNDHILLATRKGQAIRFSGDRVRPMGRPAGGVIGIKFKHSEDQVVSMGIIPAARRGECQILTASERGFGKRTAEADYPLKGRGGQGVISIDVSSRNGDVVGVQVVCESDELMLITEKGILIRTRVEDIRLTGRNAQGVRLIRLDKGDKLVAMTRIETENGEPTEPEDRAATDGANPSPSQGEGAGEAGG